MADAPTPVPTSTPGTADRAAPMDQQGHASSTEQSWVGKAQEYAENKKQDDKTQSGAGSSTAHTLSDVKKDAVRYLHDQRDALTAHAAQAREKITQGKQDALQAFYDKAASLAQNKQGALVQELSAIAAAVSEASRTLEERSDTRLAGYASSLGRTVERGADYLKQRPPAELLDEGRRLARRYPEVVYGGMFIVGLAAARFLKASEQRRDTSSYRPDTEDETPNHTPDQNAFRPSTLDEPSSIPKAQYLGPGENVRSRQAGTAPTPSSELQ